MNIATVLKTSMALPLVAMLALAGCGGGSGAKPKTPPFAAADVAPALAQILRGANSVLSSDVLDFSENPPIRFQSGCRLPDGVADCTGLSGLTLNDVGQLAASRTTFEPVGEHRGVSLFRITGPYVDEDNEPYANEWYVEFGGWLDHSFFIANKDIDRTTGHLNEDVEGASIGRATGTNPLSGGATWSGVMVGIDVSASAARGNEIQGNVDLTIGNFADPMMDIAFAGIRDIDTGAQRADMTWENIPVTGGGFSTGADGNSVQGQFYGPDHEEVGGTFERNQIIGAFGASR